MPSLFAPSTAEHSQPILCCYTNRTGQIQIVRISNISNWYFERVIFPGQRLLFEAPIDAQLEIHTGAMASAISTDTLPCYTLQVQQPEPSGVVSHNQ